ncbi:MAG: single-stranded-DNA-specific exonuclease RecJ [Acidobacteria bacterium]|nr:single-stranded-DNA-specific exonuclease RecJ [Acidobacteriota bacterium]
MSSAWIVPEVDKLQVAEVAGATGVPLPLAEMLVRRGFATAHDARAFLHPTRHDLHEPSLLLGMDAAVERLRRAILNSEPILIYGDYDVDGTTATVLLKTAIDRVTPSEQSLVRFHIPHRIREGYGMQTAVLAGAAEAGIRLVISVDTGIRAFAAAQEAKAQGMDLIVTDHHLPESAVPDAVAVINPNQPGCPYPYKDLCGAAVACKLAEALLLSVCDRPDGFKPITLEALDEKFLPSFMKLLAIATIADSMPLTGENRAIVTLGLEQLRRPVQHGLRALMQLSNFTIREGKVEGEFTARDVAFRIAPRINAAGRMDTASDVVQLFLTRDAQEGRMLAEKLHALNAERRESEATILREVEETLAAMQTDDPGLEKQGVVVVDGEGWHRGVIGILASRVLERTQRPALVIAHEDGVAHGSGRSIEGFHLLDAITAVQEMKEDADKAPVFDRFGGHAYAVGFALPSNRVEVLKRRLSQYARGRITSAMMSPDVVCDAELKIAEIDSALIAAVKRCEPFGNGNPEPTFVAWSLTLVEPVRVLKERHAKLKLQQEEGGTAIACLCWGREQSWPERLESMGVRQGSVVDVLFRLRENLHPDFGGPELEICDLRLKSS